jgi:hypothetical protein
VTSEDEAAPPEEESARPGWRRALRLPALSALPLRLGGAAGDIAWADRLFWLFRVVAALELAKGLFHWTVLLAGGAAFAGMPAAFRVTTAYFAALDPVAGIGMWMTSSWGAVLWLVAAASQMVLCIVAPGTFGYLWPAAAVELAAVGCYVWFTLEVAAGQTET